MPTFQAPIADSRSASKYAQAQLCRLDVMSEIVGDFEAAVAQERRRFKSVLESRTTSLIGKKCTGKQNSCILWKQSLKICFHYHHIFSSTKSITTTDARSIPT